MNIPNGAQFSDPQRGNTLVVVMLFCMALLVVSTAFMGSMANSRRMANTSELFLQSREAAEAALGYATAELNKKATSLASLSDDPLNGYALSTADKANLAGATVRNNVVSGSLEVKAGKISAAKTDMILDNNDPAFAGDQSAGLRMDVRSGFIYAKATAKDPMTGKLNTTYISGVIQVREQTWLNYGMFYNMDMEIFPGKPMDIRGAIHTNADMFLGSDGSTVNFYKKVTAAGHIYHGIKYCAKGFNADKSVTGFEDKSGAGAWAPGGSGEGTGKVWPTKDGTTLVEMTANMDSLGTKTNPAANTSTWIGIETSSWNKYVMDVSLSVDKFTPPGLPLYVPEDYSTKAVTEMRNHGYSMVEPQLPATDDRRYYGRKSAAVENLKFSALAGMTIVVEDLDLTSDATAAGYYVAGVTDTLSASVNGRAIPWKLVWYEGAVLPGQPLSKENLPDRDGVTLLPKKFEIDPFGRNDEVDLTYDATTVVTMRRNLKALLRDAIVVVPYRDSDAAAGTFGSGKPTVTINSFPTGAGNFVFTPDMATTRWNQPAGAYPDLNTATDNATYWPINYGNNLGTYPGTERYPDYSTAAAAASKGTPNTALNKYSGIYDRRQGYSPSTGSNDALKGAMHVVYIDLQKLNWIINNPTLWKHPVTNAVIYDFSKSYTNLIYVDLPSKAKDVTRFALTDSDKVCPAASPTSTKPGYCVILDKGARLPRLPYDDSLRTPGFTFATNGPLYIKGNYNADGMSGTGDSIQPDSANWYSSTYPLTNEVPAMVAADAVTFLTDFFQTANSAKAVATGKSGDSTANGGTGVPQLNGYANNATITTPKFQEISTAMICGLTPTIPHFYSVGNTAASYTNAVLQCSGWVNNLPRFLENNGSLTVRYRGSMAALFECEVANAHFIQGQHSWWYSPPTRDWGYHQYLAAGKYPPGTPVMRTTRLISVSDISASQYTAGPTQPP